MQNGNPLERRSFEILIFVPDLTGSIINIATFTWNIQIDSAVWKKIILQFSDTKDCEGEKVPVLIWRNDSHYSPWRSGRNFKISRVSKESENTNSLIFLQAGCAVACRQPTAGSWCRICPTYRLSHKYNVIYIS